MRGKFCCPALCVWGILAFVLVFTGYGEANSFPFRAVNVGDQLPAVTVKSVRTQQDEALAKFKGKPLALVFFGADIPTKRERSIKALQAVQKMADFLKGKGVNVLAIDAQGDDVALINEVVSESTLTLPVYVDAGKQAYGNLGIFVMPSVMLVAADGAVFAGMGYSHDLGQRLKGEVEVMLGEKTSAQVEEELRPVMVEKSQEEKSGNRHYALGMTMIEKGQPESAMIELVKAIGLEPGLGKAHVHLGCLQMDAGQVAEAKASLAKGMGLEPDMVEGKICQARVKAAEGAVDDAIDDINYMMLRNSRNDTLHYVLGGMLEGKSDLSGAMKEYRKAYELLEKKSHEK
ncbi:MAG: redoxin family protein [Desulfobulbaceae bacterium]|nr:redoxin family protein [Desulfobulbaceae bacterium]